METKNKIAIYADVTGKVCVMRFAHNIYVPDSESTPKREDFVSIGDGVPDNPDGYRRATVEELARRDAPEGVEIFIVDSSNELFADRYFRNAWVHREGDVSIDMGKAREIHKEVLRQERAPLLAQLDLEYMRADEDGDAEKKSDIILQKKVLRDITKHPEIIAAANPDELKIAGLSTLQTVKGE